MRISPIKKPCLQSKKFVTIKPERSFRIFDGHLLPIRVPSAYKSMRCNITKYISGIFDGMLSERHTFTYDYAKSPLTVTRSVVNKHKMGGLNAGYKKTSEFVGSGYSMVQTWKDNVYSSKRNFYNSPLQRTFSVDFKQDELPKSVVGAYKKEQVTYYTEQPNLFKKTYLRLLTGLVTDKNGCEKTNSKMLGFVAKLIDKNVSKKPIRTDVFEDVELKNNKLPRGGLIFNF